MDVVGDVSHQHIRHACILLSDATKGNRTNQALRQTADTLMMNWPSGFMLHTPDSSPGSVNRMANC